MGIYILLIKQHIDKFFRKIIKNNKKGWKKANSKRF